MKTSEQILNERFFKIQMENLKSQKYLPQIKEAMEEYANQFKQALDVADGKVEREIDWFKTQEAFVTAMKIDEKKSTYDHLQMAFYWFKENYPVYFLPPKVAEAPDKLSDAVEFEKWLMRQQDLAMNEGNPESFNAICRVLSEYKRLSNIK